MVYTMQKQKQRSDTFLVVEDSLSDSKWIRDVLREEIPEGVIQSVTSGNEGLDYLNRVNQYQPPADSPRPDLIILDLYPSEMNGIQFLQHVRSSNYLTMIPTVILTGSRNSRDMEEIRGLNPFCVVEKTKDSETDRISLRDAVRNYCRSI